MKPWTDSTSSASNRKTTPSASSKSATTWTKTSNTEEAFAKIHDALARARAAYSLIFSHGTYIDILPHRASKGKAVRYLAGKWHIPLERLATSGDSGNDLDMLVGRTAGIVVGNHDEELLPLKNRKTGRIYFAHGHYADGIIEGLHHYGIIARQEAASA